ncbi:MAG: hypothetical protein ABEH88_05185 [Halobacteriales archaeon]
MATIRNPSDFDAESVGSASNVMLLAPSPDSAGSEVCAELLSVQRPSEEDVLAVTLDVSPDEWLDRWERNVGPERPAKTSFVTVDDQTRSVAASATADSALPGGMRIHTASSPTDLTGIGVRISEQLSDWDTDDNRTIVDFDSLTALLESNEQQSVFKFIHFLSGRITTADALAHYHMDPAAHEDQEIKTFESVMDAVVEVEEDGTCSVSS